MLIGIEDYDPRWPALFERQAERIKNALGERALQIHHAGSTSVPGLAAKPVLDIVLTVADSADEDAYAAALSDAGYRLVIREEGWHQHRMFKPSDVDVNLHVFSQNCPEVDRMLAFRDWLRSNPTDRIIYERAKKELAQQEWTAVQDYADAKTRVVTEIMQRALGVRDSRQPIRSKVTIPRTDQHE